MQCLVSVNAKPVLTFAKVYYRMQYSFDDTQHQAAADQKYRTAMDQCMRNQPIVPTRKTRTGGLVNLGVPALGLRHDIPLENIIAQRMSYQELKK